MKRASFSSLLLVFGLSLSPVQVALSEPMGANKPCHDDVQKFCADVKPSKGRIAKCLEKHEAELSPACKEHRLAMREHMKEVREECKEDVQKFCKEIKPGRGRLAACLKSHENELSEACRANMKR